MNYPDYFDPSILRSYDIRGQFSQDFDERFAYEWGRAFAKKMLHLQVKPMAVVGYDGRFSSPTLAKALAFGLNRGGIQVVNLGLVPSPVVYFATCRNRLEEFDTELSNISTGIMITASHNPKEDNGFKMVLEGQRLSGEDIQAIAQGLQAQCQYSSQEVVDKSKGVFEGLSVINLNLKETYFNQAISHALKAEQVSKACLDKATPLKVVVDAGNGVSGGWTDKLLERLGFEVISLFCDVDGRFPNHHPDPVNPQNLKHLIQAVQDNQAHLGIALDGDGDRLGAVDERGRVISADWILVVLAQSLLAQNLTSQVKIVFDVKCTQWLTQHITAMKGEAIKERTGHSFIAKKMKQVKALLAGEMSGHIFFNDGWGGFDDGTYSALRLALVVLKSIQNDNQTLSALLEKMQFGKTLLSKEVEFECSNQKDQSQKMEVIKKTLKQVYEKEAKNGATMNELDGVMLDLAHQKNCNEQIVWGLIRPSNTSAKLTARFEASGISEMETIIAYFHQAIKQAGLNHLPLDEELKRLTLMSANLN